MAKTLSFKSAIDALSRSSLRFTKLNGRDQGKVHGRSTEGFPDGGDSATIEDVLHSMGCDLFGNTKYKITIQAEEIRNAKQKKIKKEESSREVS
jgi:hypothetical protein